MLQINTGKLYERGIGRTNQLTGVLYANVRLPYERTIVTNAGTLRSAGSGPADLAIVYDLEEMIELADPAPGVLISHTVGPFLDDFAVVASFGLGGVFSRDLEIVRTLTGGRPGFSSYEAPENFVTHFFDRSIYITDKQADAFVTFVDALLALERRSYLGAMRAMRTFVAGLHRIPDDLALAYTLIVSSILDAALQQAYGFRSAYIHRLRPLPTPISLPHEHWETTKVERRHCAYVPRSVSPYPPCDQAVRSRASES